LLVHNYPRLEHISRYDAGWLYPESSAACWYLDSGLDDLPTKSWDVSKQRANVSGRHGGKI
jgi:hypothetical protein